MSVTAQQALGLAMVLSTADATAAHKCAHDDEVMSEAYTGGDVIIPVLYGVPTTEHASQPLSVRRFRTQAVGSIRYHFSYTDMGNSSRHCTGPTGTVADMKGGLTSCSAESILTDAKRTLLQEKVIPAAIAKLDSLVSIDRVSQPLVITEGSCVHFARDPRFATAGVQDTDYIMLASAAPNEGSTVAWCGWCNLDSGSQSRLLRPTSGRMNFDPAHITYDDELSRRKTTMVTVHEMLHGMGFEESFLGEKSGAAAKLTSGHTIRGGKTAYMFNGRNAVTQAKEYFACDTLTGVEFDEETPSHFERRVLKDEVMAGIVSAQLTLSVVTLGVLEDFSRYYVDYSKADNMKFSWGRNAGCDFLDNQCKVDAKEPVVVGTTYWCSDTNNAATYPTYGFMSVGRCATKLSQHRLSVWEQNFANEPARIGSEEWMDSCPIVVGYDNLNCGNTSSPDDYPKGHTFSEFGRAIPTTPGFIQNGYIGDPAEYARCFSAQCPEGSRVELSILGGQWFRCPEDGSAGTVQPPRNYIIATGETTNWDGSIHCPAAVDICEERITVGPTTYVPTPEPTPKPHAFINELKVKYQKPAGKYWEKVTSTIGHLPALVATAVLSLLCCYFIYASNKSAHGDDDDMHRGLPLAAEAGRHPDFHRNDYADFQYTSHGASHSSQNKPRASRSTTRRSGSKRRSGGSKQKRQREHIPAQDSDDCYDDYY